jgi:RNA polymerase sigma factor (sigma-70 family)
VPKQRRDIKIETRGTASSCETQVKSEVMLALKNGNRQRALALLMDSYGDALYRYCCRMLGEFLAEDAHQMCFITAYDSLPSYRGQSSLRTWLYGIARHRCLDALRKARRHESSTDQGESEVAANESAMDQRLAAKQVLARCLQKLKASVRTVVVLRYMEELSFPEIAAICEEDPATVQMRLARALPLLRKCIEANSR